MQKEHKNILQPRISGTLHEVLYYFDIPVRDFPVSVQVPVSAVLTFAGSTVTYNEFSNRMSDWCMTIVYESTEGIGPQSIRVLALTKIPPSQGMSATDAISFFQPDEKAVEEVSNVEIVDHIGFTIERVSACQFHVYATTKRGERIRLIGTARTAEEAREIGMGSLSASSRARIEEAETREPEPFWAEHDAVGSPKESPRVALDLLSKAKAQAWIEAREEEEAYSADWMARDEALQDANGPGDVQEMLESILDRLARLEEKVL